MDRTIGCDLAKERPIGNVGYDLHKRSAMSATISLWRLVVRAVVRSPTIGEDRWQDQSLVIVPLMVATTDRSYCQSLFPTTDRTINRGVVSLTVRSILAIGRGVLHPILRSIVASGDRSHDRSWQLRPIVRLVAPSVAKACDKSGQVASSRTTERDVVRRVARPIIM